MITSATAITPISCSPLAKNKGVFPSPASRSYCPFISSATETCPLINRKLPPNSRVSESIPERPLPGKAVNSDTSEGFTFFSSAYSNTALASGCSLFCSREQARARSSASVTPSAGSISVTFGWPLVIVPVLSKATISIFPASSRETAVLNIMPFLAPIPLPTIMATGVANPKAQGQLITSTEIPLARAKPTLCPASSHTAMVITAMVITVGTKIPDTLSATFAIGAFVAAASLTI